MTKEGSVLGTVPYMAPEQLKGTGPDPRSDIFSLGIVLYQMVSGRRPFKGATSAEVISSILRDSPPPVTDLKMDLPPHLGRIVKRCLEKDVTRRYQSSADLRNELEELKREIETGQMFETKARTAIVAEQTAIEIQNQAVAGSFGRRGHRRSAPPLSSCVVGKPQSCQDRRPPPCRHPPLKPSPSFRSRVSAAR